MDSNSKPKPPLDTMRELSLDLNLPDSDATLLLGAALARGLPPSAARCGVVAYLRGELGAGKTTCVRSLLRALGVTAKVRSPTYTLVDTYDLAAWTCVHVDLYRLRAPYEVLELGLADMAGPRSMLLIEWPENGGAAVPPADIEIVLRYREQGRQAHVQAATPLGREWLSNLGLDTSLAPYLSNLT